MPSGSKHLPSGTESLEVDSEDVGQGLVVKRPLRFHIAEALVAIVLVVISQALNIRESAHQMKQAGVLVIVCRQQSTYYGIQ